MRALWKGLGVLSAGMLLFTSVQAFAAMGGAAMGDAANGGKLYMASCASCHKEKPGKMMGKPVDALVAKMKKYKDMACPAGKVAEMQKALKPWGDKEMTDTATYLNGLK